MISREDLERLNKEYPDVKIVWDEWKKRMDVWEEISESYYYFRKEHIATLRLNYNIDSGKDYADYIFNLLGLTI